jgi:hypothetical protein
MHHQIRRSARRRRDHRRRSRWALLMVVVRLATLVAALGAVALPATAHADTPTVPTATGGGTAPGNPGFSWQTVFFPAASNPDGVDETVVYVWDNTGTFNTGAPDKQAEWMSVNGGPWYQFTTQSDGIGGYQTTLSDPSALPAFLDPNLDSADYGLFVSAILNSLYPPNIPVFPPPSTDPPVLDSNPDPAAPPDAPVQPDTPPGDTVDPGGDPWDSGDLWGGGGGDPGGGCGGDVVCLED